jgi:hypothetical protein
MVRTAPGTNPATGLPAKSEATPTRFLLNPEMHKRGCPMNDSRTEDYLAKRPISRGGGQVRVVRCIDCGNAQYIDVRTNRVADDIDPNATGSFGPMEVDAIGAVNDEQELD